MSRDAKEILRILNNDALRVETLQEVTSTNELLLARGEAGEPEGLILTADRQTAGRGRSGRSFFSPDQTGIYTSILLRPRCSMEQIGKLTPLAAVAVCEVLEEIASCPLQIKWVNDIYSRNRKICGILAQAGKTFTDGIPDCVVLGIGIDLFPTNEGLPKEIEEVAGSLWTDEREVRERKEEPFLKEEILGRLWKRFYELYQNPDDPSCVEYYRSRLLWVGQDICAYDGADGSERTAKLLGVDEDYSLILHFEGETAPAAVRNGEIRIRRRL